MKKKKIIKELLKNIPDAYIVIKEGHINEWVLKLNGSNGSSIDAYLLHALYAIANTDGRTDHVKELMGDEDNDFYVPGVNRRAQLLKDVRYYSYFLKSAIHTRKTGRPFAKFTLKPKGKKLLSLLK